MGIQLKKEGDYNTEKLTSTLAEEYSGEEYEKFKGGIGDGTVDIDKINDLPTYTGPTYVPTKSAGVSNMGRRSIIYKIIGAIIVLAVLGVAAYGINYMVNSGGKDITSQLTLPENEIGINLGISFNDNADKVKSVFHYSKGKVSVRSGQGLNIIYIDGKQVGVNTSSRSYRFFDIGINEAEKDALENMTYEYDDCMIILNDIMGGESDTYYYYNKKNNDCLVLAVNNRSNRIADMTYYTDFRKVTETLSGLDD